MSTTCKPAAPKKPMPQALKAARANLLELFTPVQLEQIREYWKPGGPRRSHMGFRHWLKSEFGLNLSHRRLSKFYLQLFGSVVPPAFQGSLPQFSPEERRQIAGWFRENDLLTYSAAQARARERFGRYISVMAIQRIWQEDVAPAIFPAAGAPGKSVELSVTVREGETVTGTTSLKLPLHKPPEAPAQ